MREGGEFGKCQKNVWRLPKKHKRMSEAGGAKK
jgi:hypothetical protein